MIHSTFSHRGGRWVFLLLAGSLPLLFSCISQTGRAQVQVPALTTVLTDGSGEEYSDADRFMIVGTSTGTSVDKDDLSAALNLAWTKEGLSVYINVIDDSIVPGRKHAWEGDGVEIFIADSCGSESLVQYSIAMLQPTETESSLEVFDRRYGSFFLNEQGSLLNNPADCKIGKKFRNNGYSCEVFIPFRVLFGTDSIPASLALELWVNDADTKGGRRTQYSWNYSGKVLHTSWAMNSLELADSRQVPDFPIRGRVIDEEMIELLVCKAKRNGSLAFRDQEGNPVSSRQMNDTDGPFELYELVDVDPQKLFYVDVFEEKKLVARVYTDLLQRIYRTLPEPYRFTEDIRSFEYRDKRSPAPEGACLFVGSSSIVMWKSLQRDMKGVRVINRGFGGSTAGDLLHYFDRVVVPYKPSCIVYYEGDNDLGSGMKPKAFVDSTRVFIDRARAVFPDVDIYLLSVKPSFARIRLSDRLEEANTLLSELADAVPGVYFIDVARPMYDETGKLRKDIFLEDGLHMNAGGYAIWTAIVRAALGLPELTTP